MASKKHLHDLEKIAELRAHGKAQGWPIPQIVEAIVNQFGVTHLKAHRLARGWTRRKAVEEILKTYDADGCGWRPNLTCQRLCAWEHDPRVRPGEDYLDRLCRVYETRPDQLGYGHDYTRTAQPVEPAEIELTGQPAAPATCSGGDQPPAAYAGASKRRLRSQPARAALRTTRSPKARRRTRTGTSSCKRWAQAAWPVLLDHAAKESAQLSQRLEESNAGPVTITHLQLQVASLLRNWEHTPSDQMFAEVLDQRRQVAALLEGTPTFGLAGAAVPDRGAADSDARGLLIQCWRLPRHLRALPDR